MYAKWSDSEKHLIIADQAACLPRAPATIVLYDGCNAALRSLGQQQRHHLLLRHQHFRFQLLSHDTFGARTTRYLLDADDATDQQP